MAIVYGIRLTVKYGFDVSLIMPDVVTGRGRPFLSYYESARIEKFHNYYALIYCIPLRFFLELCHYNN